MFIRSGSKEVVVNHKESRFKEIMGQKPGRRYWGGKVETARRGHFSKKFGCDESSLETLCFPTCYERTKL